MFSSTSKTHVNEEIAAISMSDSKEVQKLKKHVKIKDFKLFFFIYTSLLDSTKGKRLD